MLRKQLFPRLRPQETLVAESNCQVPTLKVSLCLFMSHVEEKYFHRYAARTPNLHKRYIDDVAGAFSSQPEVHLVYFR